MFLITMRELSRPRRNSRAIAQVDRPDSGRRLFHSRHVRTFLRGLKFSARRGKALELVQEADPRLSVAAGLPRGSISLAWRWIAEARQRRWIRCRRNRFN